MRGNLKPDVEFRDIVVKKRLCVHKESAPWGVVTERSQGAVIVKKVGNHRVGVMEHNRAIFEIIISYDKI